MRDRRQLVVGGAALFLSGAALAVAVLAATVLDDRGSTATSVQAGALSGRAATGIASATFAQNPAPVYAPAGNFAQVAAKALPEGSWVVVATANVNLGLASNLGSEVVCELRFRTHRAYSFIGGATTKTVSPPIIRQVGLSDIGDSKETLSMNGGAQIPAGGGELSLWCKGPATVTYAQMMMLRIDGFS
jgi:hypothetical protein